MAQYTYIIYDIESTGLNVREDRVIQLAAKAFGNDDATTFNTYVRADKESSPGAFAVHGISTDMLRDSPSFPAAFEAFARWIDEVTVGTPVLVSHNNFRFDYPIMDAECRRHGLSMNPGVCLLDSMDTARQVFHSYSMGYMYFTLFGRELQGAHNAMADVLALEQILQHDTVKPMFLSTRILDQNYFHSMRPGNHFYNPQFHIHNAGTGINAATGTRA